MGPDVIGGDEFAELAAATVEEMVDIAAWLPAGAVVGRRLDNLIWRSEPSEVGGH
jgi:hypothetical protein